MDREIEIGFFPFCGDSSKRCGVTPGYKTIGKVFGSGLRRCWTGHKAKCRFDFDTFKKTTLFQKLKNQNQAIGLSTNFFPEYKWFGTAPFCAPNKGDLAKEGYVFVKTDRCGDGRCCTTGNKMLGMKPETTEQEQELKEELKKVEEDRKKRDAFIDKAITGMKTLGDYGSKYGGYIPVIGPGVKAVGDGLVTVANLLKGDKKENQSKNATGYNDSFINPTAISNEFKELANDSALSKLYKNDPDNFDRFSVIKDVYERLLNKDPKEKTDQQTISKLRDFLDTLSQNKNFKNLLSNDVKKTVEETANKTIKEIVSDIQKNANVKGYLTNFAKDYYKYKDFQNSLPNGGL